MSVEPGQHVGAYVIGELLGQGGMGAVYRAQHIETSVDYALKVIRPDVLAEMHPEDLNRFHREAELLAQLDSEPSVVRVHSFEASAHCCYYVMELVDGESLAQRVDREPLGVEQIVQIMAQSARAMHRVHAHGIVHRDLKPANILLDRKGQVRILDFGLALNPKLARLTMTGEVMGTPAYMAPEQADGASEQRAAGAGIDVYGLGAVLYRLLVGQAPFEGRDPVRVLLQVVTAHPKAPRQLLPTLSRSLEAICLKALEKEPHNRYASAGDMADDLERWLQGQPVHARNYSNATLRLRRFLPARGPRRKVMQAALVIAVATALLGLPLAMGGFGIRLRGDWSESAFFDMEETTGLLKKEVNRLYSTVQDGDLEALARRSELKRRVAEETTRHQAAIQRDTERKSILLLTSQQKLDRLDTMERIQRRSNRWMEDKALSDALLNDFLEPLKKIYLEPDRKAGLAALLEARKSLVDDLDFVRKVVRTIDSEHPIFESQDMADLLDTKLKEDGIEQPENLSENEKLRADLRGSQLSYVLHHTPDHSSAIDLVIRTLLPTLERIEARPTLTLQTRDVLVKQAARAKGVRRINASLAILITFPDGDERLLKAFGLLGPAILNLQMRGKSTELYEACLWVLRLGYWPLELDKFTDMFSPFADFEEFREKKLIAPGVKPQSLDLNECALWLLQNRSEINDELRAQEPKRAARYANATLKSWDAIEPILERNAGHRQNANQEDAPTWAISCVTQTLWRTNFWQENDSDSEEFSNCKREIAEKLAKVYRLEQPDPTLLRETIEDLYEQTFASWTRRQSLHRRMLIPSNYLEWRNAQLQQPLQQASKDWALKIFNEALDSLKKAIIAKARPPGIAYGDERFLSRMLSSCQRLLVLERLSTCIGPTVGAPACHPSIDEMIESMKELRPNQHHWRAARMAHLLMHGQEERAMDFWPGSARRNPETNGQFWNAFLYLSDRLKFDGRKTEAVRILELSLELKPRDIWDLHYRSRHWRDLGEDSLAKQDLEAADRMGSSQN